MLRKLRRIKPAAWYGVAAVLAMTGLPLAEGLINGTDNLFSYAIIQLIGAIVAALFVRRLVNGQSDRLRRSVDKSWMIGSVLAVWFVVYLSQAWPSHMSTTLWRRAGRPYCLT